MTASTEEVTEYKQSPLVNSGHPYVRDLHTTGYKRAVVSLQTPDQSLAYRLQESDQSAGVGPDIVVYSSKRPLTLFDREGVYLPLQVSEPPELKPQPSYSVGQCS